MNDSEQENGCYFFGRDAVDLLHKARENHASLVRIERMMESTASAIERSTDKLTKALIESVQKTPADMVPVSTLKWIVIFLLIFTFALIFGVEAVKTVFHSVPSVGIVQGENLNGGF